MIILGPKTAILGPQFYRILVLRPHFWWSGGPGPRAPPGSAPEGIFQATILKNDRFQGFWTDYMYDTGPMLDDLLN